jgi:hypothetical protein
MHANDFRAPNQGTVTRGLPSLSLSGWAAVAAGGLASLIIATLFATCAVLGADERPTRAGAFQIPLDRAWLAFWQEHQLWLGDPVAPAARFEGRHNCVTWEFARTCRMTAGGAATLLEHYEVIDLGRRAALAAGITPQPGTSPAPIVQAYIDQLGRAGVNWRFWIGAVLSEPLCVVDERGQHGSCIVYTTNQVLRFPKGSSNPNDVHPDLGRQTPRP